MIRRPPRSTLDRSSAASEVYKRQRIARAAFTQTAEYLEAVEVSADQWNPSDYAVHLTRRARGVPFWFSLAAHGTDAYRDAVDSCLATARALSLIHI